MYLANVTCKHTGSQRDFPLQTALSRSLALNPLSQRSLLHTNIDAIHGSLDERVEVAQRLLVGHGKSKLLEELVTLV